MSFEANEHCNYNMLPNEDLDPDYYLIIRKIDSYDFSDHELTMCPSPITKIRQFNLLPGRDGSYRVIVDLYADPKAAKSEIEKHE